MSAGSAAADPQVKWVEHSLASAQSDVVPQDCATSPDYRRAATRYASTTTNAPVISIFQLTGADVPTGSIATFGGGALKSGEPIDLNSFFGYKPSDLIELTNEWGVSIGCGRSSSISGIDETYIEVFDVDNPTTAANSLVQFVISPSAADPDISSGFAHDVAITRDSRWAVVNAENWIHVLELVDPTANPPQVIYHGFDIGNNAAGPCNPNGAVDSVAVTNERAVVTTARWSTDSVGNPIRVTWVYIIDLTPATGPVIVLETELTPPDRFVGGEFNEELPHDVAITPSRDGGGTIAVVTTTHATAFFSLISNSLVTIDFETDFRRQYQVQVDSVELTGKTAVTIADNVSGGTSKWAVRIYDLGTVGFPIAAGYVDPNPPFGGSRAHDFAIDWDFDKGLVRTSYSNVVLTSLTSPPPTGTVLLSPNGSDAYAYQSYGGTFSERLFSSDSVALGIEQGGVLRGATIGGGFNFSSSRYEGFVDLIDLSTATPTLIQTTIAPDPLDQFWGSVPCDLAIAFNQTDVVVRSADRYQQPGPTPPALWSTVPGPDLVQIDLASGAILKSWGGSGLCRATDSLGAPAVTGFVNTARRVPSVSFEPSGSPFPDFFHFAR
ncbi:MAG: hypothetical protein HUU28_04620 [Planctomycetaceae bacterium]|nr:hypothetical protein [Planctomycetaceae bacterium]